MKVGQIVVATRHQSGQFMAVHWPDQVLMTQTSRIKVKMIAKRFHQWIGQWFSLVLLEPWTLFFLMGHLNFAGYWMVIEIACITNIENSVCDDKGDMHMSCVSNSQTHNVWLAWDLNFVWWSLMTIICWVWLFNIVSLCLDASQENLSLTYVKSWISRCRSNNSIWRFLLWMWQTFNFNILEY
jgi:hypothetical protein